MGFDDLRYTHLPRALNRFADALATLASMIETLEGVVVHPLLVETKVVPTYCCLIDESVFDNGLLLYHNIVSFLDLTNTRHHEDQGYEQLMACYYCA